MNVCRLFWGYELHTFTAHKLVKIGFLIGSLFIAQKYLNISYVSRPGCSDCTRMCCGTLPWLRVQCWYGKYTAAMHTCTYHSAGAYIYIYVYGGCAIPNTCSIRCSWTSRACIHNTHVHTLAHVHHTSTHLELQFEKLNHHILVTYIHIHIHVAHHMYKKVVIHNYA